METCYERKVEMGRLYLYYKVVVCHFFLRLPASVHWTFRLFDTNHRLQVINIEFPFTIRVTAPTKSLKRKVNQTPYTQALQDSPEILRRLTEKLNTAFQGVDVKEVTERIVIRIEDVCLISHLRRKTLGETQPSRNWSGNWRMGTSGKWRTLRSRTITTPWTRNTWGTKIQTWTNMSQVKEKL